VRRSLAFRQRVAEVAVTVVVVVVVLVVVAVVIVVVVVATNLCQKHECKNFLNIFDKIYHNL
jgi:hypothetical protein